jgi:hypothetical protein
LVLAMRPDDARSDGADRCNYLVLGNLELRCHLHHYDEHEGQWKPERARRHRARGP